MIVLVDALGLVYRGHFACIRAPLIDDEGRDVSGFLWSTQKLEALQRFAPGAKYALVWDCEGRPCRRKALDPSYKSNRSERPEPIDRCVALLRQWGHAQGWFQFRALEDEADDAIATLVADHPGEACAIVSADKDLLALVSDGCHVYRLAEGAWVDVGPATVRAEWGVEPGQIPHVLALMGDSADGIPGVRGIGEKGAKSLIQEHGSLAQVYEWSLNADAKMAAKLEAGHEDALRALELVTLRRDAPIEVLM